MERTPENIVSSFFYYMWNAWCQEECEIVFKGSGCPWTHFWNKWCGICKKYGVFGASEQFYAELGNEYRERLVNRAIELYNGSRNNH